MAHPYDSYYDPPAPEGWERVTLPITENTIPTEFTAQQLERLNALVQRANSRGATPEDHNLERKLMEYCSIARILKARSAA